jgi:dTDP-4-dehydrorhamnose reductase
MCVLVLGATGMLGHKALQVLVRHSEVTGTVRDQAAAYAHHPVLSGFDLLGDVRAEDFDSVVQAVAASRPQVVLNCIGIIKQLPAAHDPLVSIGINALFPHRLARLCRAVGARLIHLSTDCVFSGRRGNYSEDDPPDAEDLYGRSKLLGEVTQAGCLTIRTSMIGRELQSSHGLIEWLLSQQGRSICGFSRAIFSGLPTLTLAECIARVILEHPQLEGLRHVAAAPIDKHRLLTLVRQIYDLDVQIEAYADFVCDRSLDGSRFAQETGWQAPDWPAMIAAMHADPTPYAEIRSNNSGA